MGLGNILVGAGHIGREYESDVTRGMQDSTRHLANMQALNSLREQEQMQRARQSMANMPSFDYEASTAAPALPAAMTTPGALPAASAAAPRAAPAQPVPMQRPQATSSAAAPALPASAVDPWVAQNRQEEAEKAKRAALASQYGPFGALVDWFGGIKAEEESRRQAYIAEATGVGASTPRGLGTRSVSGQIAGAAPQPRPAPQHAAPQPAAPQPAAPQPAAPGAQPGAAAPSVSYMPPSGVVGQQARMMDMQAKQLMHMLQSWKDAGAPAGMYDQVMAAQGKLAELAVNRVALETTNAIHQFERGGDPRAAVALLSQVTGGGFGVYQHPQNPQMFAIGPQGADPASLRWMNRQQLANDMRMVSDQKFSQMVWEMQRKMAEKRSEQQGAMEVEGVKGQYSLAGKAVEAEANLRKPQTMNTPGGGQVMATPIPGGGFDILNPSAPRPKVAGEQMPNRPEITRVQPNQSAPTQPAQPGRVIVPGYQ